MNRRYLTALVVVAATASIGAQTGDLPSFDAASIKPNKSGSSQVGLAPQPGGRFTAMNASVVDLVRAAYGTAGPWPLDAVVGGPGWLSSDRFDIEAKAAGEPSFPELQIMIRSLLRDRFHLETHNEPRSRPVYLLAPARSDRRLGPQMHQTSLDCSAPSPQCQLHNAPGKLSAASISMEMFCRLLVGWVDDHRPVRDETGLKGNYSVELDWAPSRQSPTAPDDSSAQDGASLFTALQEQLGLKLQPSKDDSEVLVIDHVERPTEN